MKGAVPAPDAIDLEQRTLPRVLHSRAEASPDGVFMTDAVGAITWSDAVAMAGAVRTSLGEMGVSKGDPLALMLRNGRQFVQTWFGAMFAGAIEVPINPDERGARLAFLFEHSQCRTAVVDADCLDEIERIRKDLRHLERVVVVGDASQISMPGLEVIPYDHLLTARSEADPTVPRFLDPAAVLYTSGSTGPGQGVVLSHAQHFTNGKQPVQLFDVGPTDVRFMCVPFDHTMAQGYCVWPALLSGASVRLEPKFDRRLFWEQTAACRATIWPFIGAMLVIIMKGTGPGSSTLRVGFGVPIPADLKTRFEQTHGFPVLHCYGATEVTICTWATDPASPPGSVGKPLPDFTVEDLDEFNGPAPNGEPGQISARPQE